jgi:hypothetical protein
MNNGAVSFTGRRGRRSFAVAPPAHGPGGPAGPRPHGPASATLLAGALGRL